MTIEFMAYRYISLPINLASNELISNLHNPRSDQTLLVSYLIESDIMGFSSILSTKGTEYLCESEEEFHTKVSQAKLMRIL